jgi:hypothetical protein
VFGSNQYPTFIPRRVKRVQSNASNLLWKLSCQMKAEELVAHFQEHPALQGWVIELCPPQPLMFIAHPKNIVSLVRQLRATGTKVCEDYLFCAPPLTVAQLERECDQGVHSKKPDS